LHRARLWRRAGRLSEAITARCETRQGASLAAIIVDTRDPRLLILYDPWGYGDDYGWLGNPSALGLNYQSFGTWIDYSTTGGRIVASTTGVPSSVASVPATGTATYRGFATGIYVDPTRTHAVTASAIATADFAKASIALALGGTVAVNANLGGPYPNLDLSGTLTSAEGANAFSGPVATKGGGAANAPMSGTANALFYGPGAPEVGGVSGSPAPELSLMAAGSGQSSDNLL
jgi:hypothetical protein